jgi:hypothetical protein
MMQIPETDQEDDCDSYGFSTTQTEFHTITGEKIIGFENLQYALTEAAAANRPGSSSPVRLLVKIKKSSSRQKQF